MQAACWPCNAVSTASAERCQAKLPVSKRYRICYLPTQDGSSMYMGCIVGRVANRIAGGSFEIDGVVHNVTKNNNGNLLHGKLGFTTKSYGSMLSCTTTRKKLNFMVIDECLSLHL